LQLILKKPGMRLLLLAIGTFGILTQSQAFTSPKDSAVTILEHNLMMLTPTPSPRPDSRIDTYDLKPSIGLGVGNFTFFGDISNNHKKFHPTVSRIAWQLRVSHPLNNFLELEFHTIFGRVSANERSAARNLNFESRIRMGGVSLAYNFNHILASRPKRNVEPYVGLGVESFEFLSKTDKFDKYGNEYHYWSDGSIRNLAEDAPNAASAIRVYRDYIYETDLREQNFDGNGKYPERSWAFPVIAGVTFYTGDNFKFRIQSTMHFTTTDLVDDITAESAGSRAGTRGTDKLLFTSFYVTYDLQKIKKDVKEPDLLPEIWEEPLFALDTFDTDFDGIVDHQDPCPWTPKGVQVDEKGCPLDVDGDNVPDYMDDEVPTVAEAFVNKKGVELTDEDLDRYWNVYYDSTGEYSGYTDSVRTTAYSEGGGLLFGKPKKETPKEYVIVLDKKKINVKANELYQYLNYQDFKTIQEGDTVYYVISGFKDLASAKATKQDLENKGVKTQGIAESSKTKTGENTVETIGDGQLSHVDASTGEIKTILPSESQEIVYRVQIAALTKPVPAGSRQFDGLPDVVQLKGADGLVRYYSGSFTSLEDASKHKIILAYESGYSDAFVVAMRGGKRISLSEVTEVRPDYQEKIEEYEASVSAGIDETKIRYRIQLGEFSGDIPTDVLEQYLTLGNVKPVVDDKGKTRYITGDFGSAGEAEIAKESIKDRGISTAVVVGDYMGRILSLEEIIELLRK
jgi:hypothetical protein